MTSDTARADERGARLEDAVRPPGSLSGHPRPRESILPLRHPVDRVHPVTHVRSTAIVASQQVLESWGRRQAYASAVPETVRPAVVGIVPGTWVPVETALAHYRAIDALMLPASEQLALATGAGDKVQGALTGTMLRMSRELGVTPWFLMPQTPRIWDRVCKGGDVAVDRLGPKEALIAMHGLPLFVSPYFRVAIRSVLQYGLSLWCTRCYVTEVSCTPTSATFREAWA